MLNAGSWQCALAFVRALLRWNRGRSAGRWAILEWMRSTRRVAAESSEFAGFRLPPEVITLAVRWYVRYSLSYRDVEELLAERGIEVDHTHAVSVGHAIHPAVHRGGPAPPAHPRRSLVC